MLNGAEKPGAEVIICVHNALDDVKACLESVVASSYPRNLFKIIIIDDGSGSETADYLKEFASEHRGVQLHRKETASGYTKAANRGLKASSAEVVVLLNSDTIVPRRWLEKLVPILMASPHTGIVGPLSNAASWQSVPEIIGADGKFAINELPESMTVDSMDAHVEAAWEKVGIFPHLPILNGFCLAMKRAVFEAVGMFDEESFPNGYGEENDFCFRASDAGFSLLVAANTYVFHAKSKSFGSKRREELARAGSRAFNAKYPQHRIKNAVETMKTHPVLGRIRNYSQLVTGG